MNVRCNDEERGVPLQRVRSNFLHARENGERAGQRSRSGFFISLSGGDFVVMRELHGKGPPALSQ